MLYNNFFKKYNKLRSLAEETLANSKSIREDLCKTELDRVGSEFMEKISILEEFLKGEK